MKNIINFNSCINKNNHTYGYKITKFNKILILFLKTKILQNALIHIAFIFYIFYNIIMTKIQNTNLNNQEKAKEVPKKERNSFLLGLTGQNIVYSLIGGTFFTYFLTDIALFPALAVSIILIIGKIWDGINDPIVGSIVDKHVFKNGEKLRPLLKITPIPVGIFTVLLFVVLPVGDNLLWLRISYFVIIYICWDIIYTMQDVGIWGITAMITRNSLERDEIVKWSRTVGSCVFGIASALIPMVLEIFVNSTGMSWQLATIVFAILFGFGGALMSKKAARAQERVPLVEKQKSIKESFSLLSKNKILLLLCLGNLLGSLAIGNNLVTYFFKYEIPSDFLGTSIIGALGLTTIFFAITYVPSFISMIFADKFKKICKNSYVNVIIVAQIFHAVFRIIAYFVGFEGNRLWASMALLAVACFPTGAISVAQTSLFNDSIDYVEWKTGKRTEGVTFSMQTFFTKIASGITQGGSMIALGILGYKAIDKTNAIYIGTQSATFDKWIWPLMIITPAIAAILYTIPLFFIKYTNKQKAIVEKDLSCRRKGLKESGLSPYYNEVLIKNIEDTKVD